MSNTEETTISNEVKAVMGRYRDAYLVARTIVGFGSAIKAIGVVAGIIVALAPFLFHVMASDNSAPFPFSPRPDNSGGVPLSVILSALLAGAIVALIIFLIGIIVSAQGQILRATLDAATNTSPFLTDEQRYAIM